MADRIIAVVFLFLSGLFYYMSRSYPAESTIYVKFILCLFALLSIVLFFKPQEYKNYDLKKIFSKGKLIAALMIFVYVVIMPYLGFFVSTFIFLVAFMYMFNPGDLLKYVLFSAGFCLIVYITFQKLLFIWFPTGLLI